MFPFQLSPAEAYQYHYNVTGLFSNGPLAAIIKKETFDALGGFSGKQYLGDFEFWHLLALKFPVVAMPYGYVWYRVHDTQEMTDIRGDLKVSLRYDIAALHFFQDNTKIPLSANEKKAAIKNYKRSIFRTIARTFCKGRITTSFKLLAMINKREFDFKNPC